MFFVEIAGVNPGRRAVDFSGSRRRGDSHAAEERMQREVDAGAEMADHFFFIERDDFRLAFREEVDQKSGGAVEGVRRAELDVLDSNFERVAGFRSFNEDRSS